MRFSLDRKFLLAFLLPLAAVACSSPADTSTGGSGGTGTTGGSGGNTSTSSSGGAGGSGGAPVECEGPGFGGNEKEVAIGVVKATVVDQDGNPAVNVAVQACGTDICITEQSNASGSAVVNVNDTLTQPAFKYGDGITHAKFASLLAAGDSTFTDVVTLTLPPAGQGDAFAAGAAAESGGVTIEIPAGGSVTVDELIYEEPDQQVFRAVLLPAGANVPAVSPELGLGVVYGTAPLETVFCPPARVRVPNTLGWAAGAPVEFLVLGLDIAQHWAPYAGWEMLSDGAVSADGTEIVTAEGQGLPVLSTFGIRLKN